VARAHRGTQNSRHRRRDVIFAEDRTRLTRDHTDHVMATRTNLEIGLLRQAGRTNHAQARRHCGIGIILIISFCPIVC
jgi:predicted transposase YbfD/YdcC